jgi:hypothetical protein
MMETKHDLKEISQHFQIVGDFASASPYGSGHINDTFAVAFNQGGTSVRYIFQRINHKVFANPPALMENISRVTSHIREKLSARNVPDISRRTLTTISAKSGENFYQDNDGNYWRVYLFIEKARTYNTLQAPEQAFQAARAFGTFQNYLIDLPGGPLNETIPDFHNGQKRFRDFEAALAADSHNRAQQAKVEIEFLSGISWIFDVFPNLVNEGKLSFRTTHNDTKINNVMIDDDTGEGICVIDLDTLMPGLVLYDYGDMVRTSTCRAAEDERDLSKVEMDITMFSQLARGYLSSAGGFLNITEREHLVFAGKMITLIIGCRFLTDFLNGDTYFKVHRPGHNLDRCRTQFKLVQSINHQEEQMNSIIESLN